ncbi:MAG TPA: metalloregulator ArsR/SmtB family transcription factor [Bacteroidia bacterium]|jgi:DNA-binding transcriptional ArsR family regulator
MAYSKKTEFSKDEIKASEIAKALAHPARVAILKYLAEQKACICNDLVEHLPLSQSTVSQHLKELKTAGLIQGEIDGPRVCYCIHKENWKIARSIFSDLFNLKFEAMKKCC